MQEKTLLEIPKRLLRVQGFYVPIPPYYPESSRISNVDPCVSQALNGGRCIYLISNMVRPVNYAKIIRKQFGNLTSKHAKEP